MAIGRIESVDVFDPAKETWILCKEMIGTLRKSKRGKQLHKRSHVVERDRIQTV